MKKKILSIVIMVLAVAAFVTAAAFVSSWIAPKAEQQPKEPVMAVATDATVMEIPMQPAEAQAETVPPVQEEVPVADDGAAETEVVEPVTAETENAPETPVAVEADQTLYPQIQLDALLAAAAGQESSVIGKWQLKEETVAAVMGMEGFSDLAVYMEFTDNGECILTTVIMGYSEVQTTTYVLEGDQLVVEGLAYDYVLEGGTLTLSAQGEETLIMTRVTVE